MGNQNVPVCGCGMLKKALCTWKQCPRYVMVNGCYSTERMKASAHDPPDSPLVAGRSSATRAACSDCLASSLRPDCAAGFLQLFQTMYNENGAVWVASNLPSPPLDVRIISVSGQTVTAQ